MGSFAITRARDEGGRASPQLQIQPQGWDGGLYRTRRGVRWGDARGETYVGKTQRTPPPRDQLKVTRWAASGWSMRCIADWLDHGCTPMLRTPEGLEQGPGGLLSNDLGVGPLRSTFWGSLIGG